jgi:hypothetical protein
MTDRESAEYPGGAAYVEQDTTAHRCWLCGARLPARLLMPDGGASCQDLRWYCQDARSCTERWTASNDPRRLRSSLLVNDRAGKV